MLFSDSKLKIRSLNNEINQEDDSGPIKGGRPSQKQKLALAEFMRDQADFTAGRFQGADGRETAKRLWNQLADEVNAKGSQKRTAVQWKKV